MGHNDVGAPIGVFDSGVGGLTVLKALRRALPLERFLYVGDTARVPYGTRDAETIVQYSLGIARRLQDAGCKAIVVACNTASAVALDAMKEATDLPVLGVIEPLTHAAATLTAPGPLVALGTRGTIRSEAYRSALARTAPQRELVSVACPLFVPLVEEGWCEGSVVDEVIEHYLGALPFETPPAAILLGCTHYPLLSPALSRWLTRRGWPTTPLLESGPPTASTLEALLHANRLTSSEGLPPQFWVTDGPEHFIAMGSRFLGEPIGTVRHIAL